MNTGLPEHERQSEPSIKDAIRRVLAIKALRKLRGMVDEIEREEATDRRLSQALMVALPVLLLLVALFLYFIISGSPA